MARLQFRFEQVSKSKRIVIPFVLFSVLSMTLIKVTVKESL